jgi:hypothetical protein
MIVNPRRQTILAVLFVATGLPVATLAAAAATPATVQGRVLDAASAVPLSGARLTAGDAAATTDAQGRFALELAPGSWILEAAADGYAPATLKVEAQAGGRTVAEILLVPRAAFHEQVDVVAGADVADERPATTAVRPSEVIAVAGGGENIFRTLQTLPGVVGTDEFSSRLSVRGGGPDQNLTVMDGVEIHNPYRLYGFASAFNPETVERFDLTAGAFSARYGDRLSSLLVVENRAGSNQRVLTGSAALSLTDSNVIFEGRLPGSRGSWLLTGRRTYYDLVAERFTDSKLPSFGDLQGKTVLDLGRGRTLSFFALRSRESADVSFDVEKETEFAKGAIATHSKNDLASVTFHTPLGRRAWARTILSTYTNTDTFDFGASFRDDERRSNSPDQSGFGIVDLAVTWDGIVRDSALRQELGLALGRGHVIDAGVEAHALTTKIKWTIAGARNETEANGSSVRGGTGLPDVLDSTRDDRRMGAWLTDRWQVGSRLSLEPGLRLDRTTINDRTNLSPRLAATWSLGSATRVRAALGLHTQSPGYEKLVQSDYFMDLSGHGALALDNEHARHLLVSVERDWPGGLLARVEGYSKTFDRVIVGRLETPAETRARLAQYDFPPELASSLPAEAQVTSAPTNDGRGRAWGFDVYLARRATKPSTRLSGWASYTFGFADRTSYGRTYPFDYDRRHALSLVASFRASSRIELATTTRLASGFPYTPVLGLRVASTADTADIDGDGNRAELIPARDSAGRLLYITDRGGVSNLNTARLPFYARVDARVTFTPVWGRGRVRFYVDVMNALARKNASAVRSQLEYDPGSDRPRIASKYEGGIPFLPSFGVHVTFGTPKWQGVPRAKADPPVVADAPGASPPRASRFAVAGRMGGTRGMGIDVLRRLSPRFNLRLGVGVPASLKYSTSTGGTDYDVRMRMGAATALLDWHPFAGSFHLSGGLFASRNGFDLEAKASPSYDVGGVAYASADVGTLRGSAKVRRLAPYFGLGWGNAFKRRGRFGWILDLGVVPQGSPKTTLGASGGLASDPAFEAQLTREAGELDRRLRAWRLFPVLAASVSLKL